MGFCCRKIAREKACLLNFSYRPEIDEVVVYVRGSRRGGKWHLDNDNLPRFGRQLYENLSPYKNVLISLDPRCETNGISLVSMLLALLREFEEGRPNIRISNSNIFLNNAYVLAFGSSSILQRALPLED